MSKTKQDAYIIRDFNDAGTEERFTGGKIVPIDAGSFENYRAAGLVRTPTNEDRKKIEEANKAPAKPTPAA